MDDISLGAAVASALSTEVEGLEDVRREALEYDAFLAHRAVSRVQGYARVRGGRVPWSLIEKVTEGPGLAAPYLLENGTREFRAYTAGLLEDLAPSVRAPRLHGADQGPDGRLVLRIEEVQHEDPRPLDAQSLLKAAGDLGAMAGRWRGRVPAQPWLFTGWIDRHSQPEAMRAGLASLSGRTPQTMARLGDRIAAGRHLVTAQPRIRAILESLPHTLCHHDATGANVFVSGATVLIGWETVGPGTVGADLASLLFSSVRRGDATASVVASILNQAVTAYTEGARGEDPSIAPGDIHRGVDASIALRWKLIADVADSIRSGYPMRRGSRPDEDPEESAHDLIALTDLLLDAAQRALRPEPEQATPRGDPRASGTPPLVPSPCGPRGKPRHSPCGKGAGHFGNSPAGSGRAMPDRARTAMPSPVVRAPRGPAPPMTELKLDDSERMEGRTPQSTQQSSYRVTELPICTSSRASLRDRGTHDAALECCSAPAIPPWTRSTALPQLYRPPVMATSTDRAFSE